MLFEKCVLNDNLSFICYFRKIQGSPIFTKSFSSHHKFFFFHELSIKCIA